MGIQSFYNEDSNFLYTKLASKIEDASLMDFVAILNDKTMGFSDLNELVDCRELSDVSQLSSEMAARIALSENKRENSKLAILVSDCPVVFGLARSYEMFAEHRWESVEIFQNKDEALQWLGYEDSKKLQVCQFIEQTTVDQSVFCSLDELQVTV
jgi:hypothetical protein